MKICVIPARGGSKRIPRKNIKLFHNKPMIAWSIRAAKKSKIFDKIIVSTDDEEIAAEAEERGVEVPFMRPKEISDDYTNTTDVISHSCEWALKKTLPIEMVCCIYATAPFVRPADLRQAYEIFKSKRWEYVFTVGEYSTPIFRAFTKNDSGGVEMFNPEYFETRSQDLPKAYFDAGMFYMATPNAWIKKLRIFDKHSYPLTIPNYRIQDIDNPADWERAELMAKILLSK